MQLSTSIYDRLLRAFAATHEGEDHRCHERLIIAAGAMVLPISDEQGDWVRVRVGDLSPEGISILHHRPLTVGGEFLLQLPREANEDSATVRCLVRSSTLVAEACYRIGAEFDSLDIRPGCLLPMAAGDFA